MIGSIWRWLEWWSGSRSSVVSSVGLSAGVALVAGVSPTIILTFTNETLAAARITLESITEAKQVDARLGTTDIEDETWDS